MLKMVKQTHILAWKDKGFSSGEITKRLGRHRLAIDHLVAKARNPPSLSHLPAERVPEDRKKWIRGRSSSTRDDCCRAPKQHGRVAVGIRADDPAYAAETSVDAKLCLLL